MSYGNKKKIVKDKRKTNKNLKNLKFKILFKFF